MDLHSNPTGKTVEQFKSKYSNDFMVFCKKLQVSTVSELIMMLEDLQEYNKAGILEGDGDLHRVLGNSLTSVVLRLSLELLGLQFPDSFDGVDFSAINFFEYVYPNKSEIIQWTSELDDLPFRLRGVTAEQTAIIADILDGMTLTVEDQNELLGQDSNWNFSTWFYILILLAKRVLTPREFFTYSGINLTTIELLEVLKAHEIQLPKDTFVNLSSKYAWYSALLNLPTMHFTTICKSVLLKD